MRKLVVIVLLLNACAVFAQKIVTGVVTDKNGNPIENVEVSIVNSQIKTLTNANGWYSLEIPDGYSKLRFTKDDFVVQEAEITSNEVDIAMSSYTIRDLFDLNLEDLMNIKVVSVSKMEESLFEVPQSVIAITEDDLKQRGYIDIEQVFHDLPGFDISRGNGTEYSQIYQRGYRSNNTDRTLVLIDGVEENDLWSNSAWISRQFPLTNIKRIEVLYGPSSTIYGANAYLGVVNIITKTADDICKNKNGFGVNAQLNYGTWNTASADITLAAKKNNVSFEITGRIFKSDEMNFSSYKDWDYDLTDYDLVFYKNKLNIADDGLAQKAMNYDHQIYYNDPIFNGVRPYYSNKTNVWYVNGKFRIEDFVVGFESWRNNEGTGGWYRDDYDLTNLGGRWVPHNSSLYAKYEKRISDKLTITNLTTFKIHGIDETSEEYYYVGYLNGGLGINNLLETPDTIINYNNTTHILDTTINTANPVPYWLHRYYHTYSQQARSELRVIYNMTNSVNVLSGVEYRASDIQGQYITNDDFSNNGISKDSLVGNHFSSVDFGFFAQVEYRPIRDFNIILGGRGDYNKIKLRGGYGWVFNPKIAVVYSPRKFVFKVIYSEAFMDADNFTKFSTTPGRLLPNPTLQPEKVKNIELSTSWKINDYVLIDACAYQSMYSNIVGTRNVTFTDQNGVQITTTQHQPVGEMMIRGLQSNINFKLGSYSAYLNYTYTDPYNTSENNKVRVGDIANYHVNFGINAFYFKKLNINVRANWIGDRPTGINTTISENPLDKIDASFILYGAVSYNIWKGVSTQLLINNILDTEYFDPGVRNANGDYYAARIPQNRRNIMAKLMLEF